jgi:hypothetical protein
METFGTMTIRNRLLLMTFKCFTSIHMMGIPIPMNKTQPYRLGASQETHCGQTKLYQLALTLLMLLKATIMHPLVQAMQTSLSSGTLSQLNCR